MRARFNKLSLLNSNSFVTGPVQYLVRVDREIVAYPPRQISRAFASLRQLEDELRSRPLGFWLMMMASRVLSGFARRTAARRLIQPSSRPEAFGNPSGGFPSAKESALGSWANSSFKASFFCFLLGPYSSYLILPSLIFLRVRYLF